METNDLVSVESLINSLKSAKHDLNNLLNNVLTATDLLRDKFSDDSSLEELTAQIQNNTILASKIISQIVPQSDIAVNSFTKLNLNDLILDTIKLVDRNSVKIETSLPEHETFILGDYTNLQRVLLNLIENAKDAKKEELKIQIKLETSIIFDNKNFILLTIKDNGKGIQNKNLNKIFNDGFTTKESGSKGRGLGLSIVNEIMANHNAIIDVSSKINGGTAFKIFFPTKKFTNNSSFDNKIIVLAEDDDFQREVMSDLLKSMKINVYTASNGIEALDLYYSIKPDLLLIDDKMPGMTGRECVNKIREKDKLAQIVLVTGSSQSENCLKNNSMRVLNKPYNFDEVKIILNEML
jgi:CheY-like chemotaxis protein